MKTQRSKVSAVSYWSNLSANVAKTLIQILLCLTILFGYSIANAKPTTFNLNNNLISGNLSSPALIMDWINQVGAPDGTTGGSGASTDNSGNVYITGYTNVGISGQTQNGGFDYFIAKYGPNYNLIWSKQVGGINPYYGYGGDTEGRGISADESGNIYVTGITSEGISGQKQNGDLDYYIAKYESSGNLLWTRQVGTDGGRAQGNGISTGESGNIYVTGYTNVGISGQKQNGYDDYFIAKYDAQGNLLWTRQGGNNGGTTFAQGISADKSGNIYIAGGTYVRLSDQHQTGLVDYFIAKYDSDGNLRWTRQAGADEGSTQGNGISADNAGNIYVTGSTNVGLSGQTQNGYNDYFIAKYNANGNLQWTRQVGAPEGNTQGWGITANESRNIYVTGGTDVGLSGQKQNGYDDYFIARYDRFGNLLVTTQGGATNGGTSGYGISANKSGDVYITGDTNAALSGLTQNGLIDYFAVKYISVN